jgi:hypothetical protein
MYKCVHGKAPTYLSDNLCFQHEMSERVTRTAAKDILYIPRAKAECLKRSFHYAGPVL